MKLNFPQSLNISNLSDYKLLGLCLSIGFFIRLIPEILAFSTPIGFDTIYYGYIMKSGVIMPHWSSFFTSTWLLNAIIVPLYSVFQGDPFMLLKIIAPLLFGLNVAGVYWFARKMLGWSPRMSLIAGAFFALQLASLRISWDLLRNTLGLGVLMFALSYVKEVDSKRGFALFASLSLLAVFAHEYSAVILLVTVVGLLVWKLVKKQASYNYKMLALAIVPALTVFLTGMFLRLNPIRYATTPSNIIQAGDTISGKSGIFFLTNYLQVQDTVDSYGNYWALALNVALLFIVLFLPYILLVKKGFFKNEILSIWTGLLLVGAFGCLVMPFAALQWWHRWMFMLVYPFTFYAVYGIVKLARKSSVNGKIRFSALFSNKKAAGMILLTLTLGVAYLFTPITMVYANKSVPNLTGTQVYFSTDPGVPYQDEGNVVQAMDWLNQNSGAESCIILQRHFLEYGKLYLNNSKQIIHYQIDINAAVSKASESGFSQVFFVWWNQQVGWGEFSLPAGFTLLQDFGRISVYSYMKA